METRLAPPNGPPPPYTRVISRVYPYSLRPVMIFISIVGFIWALVAGVENVRDVGDDGNSAKMNIFSIVLGVLYFIVAGIELFASGVAILNKLQLAKLFVIAAPLGAVVAIAAELMGLILHFTLKDDLINQCTKEETGVTVSDYYGNLTSLTDAQAKDLCTASWKRGTWRDIIWFLAVIFVSALWFSIALSYYRQLLDPNSVRQRSNRRQQQVGQSYPLQQPQQPYQPYAPYNPPYHNNGGDYPTYGGGEHGGYVPPYPGPPAANSPYAPKTGANGEADAKELDAGEMSYGAQERAWNDAQARAGTRDAAIGGYAPPAGPPPGVRQVESNREEEEAWTRAREEGPTAHLTGDNTRLAGGRV